MLNGILIVDKPTDWTSFDVIAKLRGVLQTKKIGHSGTLDPMATGVLPLFVGPSSRAVDLQQDHTKAYRAEVLFGCATDTGDVTGTVLEQKEVQITAEAVQAALPALKGTQLQMPPMYSAVKVHGQPLYKLARKGQTVERTPRPIQVFSAEYLEQSGENRFTVEISCSKGTYIRVLLEDLGKLLQAPATMSGLRRIRSGVYTEAHAHTLEEIYAAREQGTLQELMISVDTVFSQYPTLQVDDILQRRLIQGAKTRVSYEDGTYRAYGQEGFLGLFTVQEGTARVEKLFIEREA